VADVDDVDALLPAAVVDREQMTPGKGEELRDARGLEPLSDQPTAVERGLLGGGLSLDRHASGSLPVGALNS
jgi:hypothetical protein